MTKITKQFDFNYNLKKKVVRDLKIVTESLPLRVTGKGYLNPSASVLEAYDRWSVDIESIEYEGKNIIEVFEYLDDQLVEIEEAAIKYVAELFNQNKNAA